MKKIKSFAELAEVKTAQKNEEKAKAAAYNTINPIKFDIRNEGGKWRVYMVGREREILGGEFDFEAQARAVVADLTRKMSTRHEATKPKKPINVKVSTPTLRTLQAVAMQLDKARRVRFYESIIAINYLIHMLTNEIDENNEVFGAFLDQSLRQRVKSFSNNLERVLDALWKTGFTKGDADSYGDIACAAYALAERFRLFVAYASKDEWRLAEFDKKFNDVCPDEYINSERDAIASRMCYGDINGVPVTNVKK